MTGVHNFQLLCSILTVLCASANGCTSGRSGENPPRDMISASDIRRTLGSVGSRLPSVSMKALDGTTVDILFPFQGPTVLTLLREEDCFTCANVQPDSWALANWAAARHGRQFGIVVSSNPRSVREYARTVRLPFQFLVDSIGWTARQFGPAVHPLLVIVSPNGVVVAVLPRTPGVINNPAYDPSIEKFIHEFEDTIGEETIGTENTSVTSVP